jgi:hypothetical protein
MQRVAQSVRAIVGAGALMAAACGGQSDPSTESPQDWLEMPPEQGGEPAGSPGNVDAGSSDAPTFCTSTVTDEAGNVYEPQSQYYFDRINAKLSSYPELRELAGFDQVSTCSEASEFLDHYQAYSLSNPGFDAETETEPAPVIDSPVEPPPSEEEMEKIFNGTGAINVPVVELFRWNTTVTPNKRSGPCTGFFVSRHYIATANHCVTGNAAWGQYQVTRKNNFSNFTWLKSPTGSSWVHLYQYKYPGWLGMSATTSDSGRDFALLYVDPRIHSQLLNPASTEAAMRIAIGSMSATQPFSIWGWGVKTATGQPPRDLLTGMGMMAVTAVNPGFFTANAGATARTCAGDSGSPATRVINSQFVALGTHIGPFPPGGQPNCPPQGLELHWCRTADKLSWIETVLQGTYGSSFACKVSGTGDDRIAKCW